MTEKENIEYEKFLQNKKARITKGGFIVDENDLNPQLFPFQKYCIKRALENGKFALFEDCGLGKEQPYSEPVLTPNGYCSMGSLRVGDYVISRNGKPTRISAIYEQGEKQVYKVSFSDGTYTRCGLNHLWNVKTLNDVSRGNNYRTVELKDMLDNYKSIRVDKRYPDKKRYSYNYSIPICGEVEFTSSNVGLDAYILGVLIGDGCISQSSVNIANPNLKIYKNICDRIQNGDIVSSIHKDNLTYCISNKIPNQPSWTKKELIRLGLMGLKSKDKFIPDEYKFASIKDRIELLQGLIDTDGHIISDGTIEYSTSSEKLADDISFVARSLGYIVRVVERYSYYKKDGQKFKNYRVYLYNNKARKLKSIVNIEEDGYEKSRCIYVEDEEHLYLTRDFIVTHNTLQQLEWSQKVVEHTNTPVLIIAPLAVVGQTIKEGQKFGYVVNELRDNLDDNNLSSGIYITNYDNIDNVNPTIWGGVFLMKVPY